MAEKKDEVAIATPRDGSIEEQAVDTEAQKRLDSTKVDAALEYLKLEATASMTLIDEKKLVRKIDWRIVPLMCKSDRESRARHSYGISAETQNRAMLLFTVFR